MAARSEPAVRYWILIGAVVGSLSGLVPLVLNMLAALIGPPPVPPSPYEPFDLMLALTDSLPGVVIGLLAGAAASLLGGSIARARLGRLSRSLKIALILDAVIIGIAVLDELASVVAPVFAQ